MWPICVDNGPCQAAFRAMQRCIRTNPRPLFVHGMRAAYRLQGMEDRTAEDILGVERLLPWAGVTSQLQTARVARGPRTRAHGSVPWHVLEQVLHLVEDFRLDNAIELDLVEAGAPPGRVSVRYMRATPERGEWHGLVDPQATLIVHMWNQRRESTQKGILVGVPAADGTFLQGMWEHEAIGICVQGWFIVLAPTRCMQYGCPTQQGLNECFADVAV